MSRFLGLAAAALIVGGLLGSSVTAGPAPAVDLAKVGAPAHVVVKGEPYPY